MWLLFFALFLACLVLLYLPGFLVARCVRPDLFLGLAVAPAVSILAFAAVGTASSSLGLRLGPWGLLGFTLLVCLLVYLVGRLKVFAALPAFDRKSLASALKVVAPYALVGFIVALFVFVLPMDGPSSLVQTYDNVFHYEVIQSIKNSNHWDALHPNMYLEEAQATAPFLKGSGGFYPGALHVFCALVAGLFSADTGMAVNSVLLAVLGVAYPVSMGALLAGAVFRDDPDVARKGAFICTATVFFPWALVHYWPLFPNAVSLCLLPGALYTALGFFAQGVSVGERWRYLALGLLSACAIALTQPSSLFALLLILAPYGFWRAWQTVRLAHTRRAAGGAVLLYALFVVAAWWGMTRLPFLQGIVGYYWRPIASWREAVLGVLDFRFAGLPGQPVLALLLFMAAIDWLRHRRWKRTWLLAAYALACAAYVVAAADGDTPLKHFVSGFWYTDPYRMAALAVLVSVPLLAWGLDVACRAAVRLVGGPAEALPLRARAFVSGLVVFVIMGAALMPDFSLGAWHVQTAFGAETAAGTWNNSWEGTPLDSEEVAFLAEAEEEGLIEPEGTIVNVPYDGSAIAYAASDSNVYYKAISGYGAKNETKDSVTLREHLYELATNESVREAVEATNAKYVLVFDDDPDLMKSRYPNFSLEQWDGVYGVNQDTPGFTLLKQEDGMSLYAIEGTRR